MMPPFPRNHDAYGVVWRFYIVIVRMYICIPYVHTSTYRGISPITVLYLSKYPPWFVFLPFHAPVYSVTCSTYGVDEVIIMVSQAQSQRYKTEKLAVKEEHR